MAILAAPRAGNAELTEANSAHGCTAQQAAAAGADGHADEMLAAVLDASATAQRRVVAATRVSKELRMMELLVAVGVAAVVFNVVPGFLQWTFLLLGLPALAFVSLSEVPSGVGTAMPPVRRLGRLVAGEAGGVAASAVGKTVKVALFCVVVTNLCSITWRLAMFISFLGVVWVVARVARVWGGAIVNMVGAVLRLARAVPALAGPVPATTRSHDPAAGAAARVAAAAARAPVS